MNVIINEVKDDERVFDVERNANDEALLKTQDKTRKNTWQLPMIFIPALVESK